MVTERKTLGVSLHIGLNAVSAAHYGGWAGELAACENDARDMAAIAAAKGMRTTTLLTAKATRSRVLAGIRAAARTVGPGGLFFLSYSGHGGQVPDVTGDEDDKQDETWCLYDGQLIDDELYFELSGFAEGARVLVLSDSCHSGTVTRDVPPLVSATDGMTGGRPKMMPRSVALRTYRDHQAFYDKLQADVAKKAGGTATEPDAALANLGTSGRQSAIVKRFKPAAVLISGCQDNQTSMDGEHNGAFTEKLLSVWNHGAFSGNYVRFHAAIRARLPSTQSPNLFALGAASGFLAQQPFSV